jgi:hypothetical protein
MEKTWKPTTAGILTIIDGTMRIALGIGLAVFGMGIGILGGLNWSSLIEEWAGAYGPGTVDIQSIVNAILGISSTIIIAIGVVLLVCGIISVVGGIYAIKRKRWGLALAGAILSLPGIMGILAIIFVSLGKKEFE